MSANVSHSRRSWA